MPLFHRHRPSEPDAPSLTPPDSRLSTNFNTLVPPSPASERDEPLSALGDEGTCVPTPIEPPDYIGADDASLAATITNTTTIGTDGKKRVIIDFDEPYDKDNPMCWPIYKKSVVLACCFYYAFLAGANGTAYTAGGAAIEKDFHVSPYVYLLGLTTVMTAVAFGPMVLAPLSEDLGRKYIYIASCFLYTILFLPQALAPNIEAIIITRFFQGLACSVGNSMVAGSVSDVFDANSRGPAMSCFVLSVFTGQAIAPVISAAFALGQWRWMFWWQMIAAGVCTALMVLFVDETRGSVVLMRRAARMTKEAEADGTNIVYRARGQDNRPGMLTLMWESSTRPFLFLTTEPVCLSFSMYVGLMWGTVFMSLSSVPVTLAVSHGFTQLESCVVLLALGVGAWLGWILGLHQDSLFTRAVKRNNGIAPPEARLYYPCVGAILFPVGLFWFGWAEPYTNAACGIVGFVVCNMGIYLIYCGVFSYMADVYEMWASSALAAQSWARNIAGGVMPLFGQWLYHALKPQYATSIVAGVAALMGTVPFMLFYFGPALRERSKVAQSIRSEKAELTRKIAEERDKVLRRQEQRERRARQAAARKAVRSTEKTPQNPQNLPKAEDNLPPMAEEADADVEKQA